MLPAVTEHETTDEANTLCGREEKEKKREQIIANMLYLYLVSGQVH